MILRRDESVPSVCTSVTTMPTEETNNFFDSYTLSNQLFLKDNENFCTSLSDSAKGTKTNTAKASLDQNNLFNNGFKRKSVVSQFSLETHLESNTSEALDPCQSSDNASTEHLCNSVYGKAMPNENSHDESDNCDNEDEYEVVSCNKKCKKKAELNILSRPKRSVHSYRFSIPENWQELTNSDKSDEDFVCENRDVAEISPVTSNSEMESRDSTQVSNELTKRGSSAVETTVCTSSSVEISKSSKGDKKSKKRRKRKNKGEFVDFDDAQTKAVLEILRNKFPSTKRPKISEGPYVIYKKDTFSYAVVNTPPDDLPNSNSSFLMSSLNKERLGIINSSDHPVCCFCHKKSEFLGMGPLFGPYKTNPMEQNSFTKNIWIHEMCCVWAPGTYVRINQLFGLNEAFLESLDKVCKVCRLKCACLKCAYPRCNTFFHYPCALSNKCRFNYEKFTVECVKHSRKKNNRHSDL